MQLGLESLSNLSNVKLQVAAKWDLNLGQTTHMGSNFQQM